MTRAIPIIRAMITSGTMNLIMLSTILVKYFMPPIFARFHYSSVTGGLKFDEIEGTGEKD
jgi:hypothetical protein